MAKDFLNLENRFHK